MEPSGATAIAKQNVNARGGPGTNHTITGYLEQGSTVPIIGKNASGSRVLVSLPAGSGWVPSTYLQTSGIDQFPVVDVPPPPPTSSGSGPSPTATATSSGSDGSGGSGGGQTAPSDSNISTNVNIKDNNQVRSGVISNPDGDTQDQLFIKIVGFDSITTSGTVLFAPTRTGEGVANVKVFGGDGCNDSWTQFFTNDSDQQTIRIYLDSGGSAYVNWTLVILADN